MIGDKIMNIRKMTKNDYTSIDILMKNLHQFHVKERPDFYIDLKHPYSEKEYYKMLDDDNILGYVAEINKKVVGLCIASIRFNSGMTSIKTVYIDAIIVNDMYRNKGITKKLFYAVEEEAKMLGAIRLDLMVWEFNQSAKDLYESLGMSVQRYIYEKDL